MHLLHLIVAASATHMPDAMETIYEKALAYGKSGGVSKIVSIYKKSETFVESFHLGLRVPLVQVIRSG